MSNNRQLYFHTRLSYILTMIKIDLLDKLCLTYLQYTNKTYYGTNYGMPNISYHGDILPDYLVLYSDIREYNKTNKTFVCFYEYDNVFNNKNGLLSALLFNDKKLLSKFEIRFNSERYNN